MIVLRTDAEIELKQLEKSDAEDIFKAIDSQREYLGKWLPFVAFTHEISDTEKFVESVVSAPEDRVEYVFTIRKQGEFIGLIGFKDTDRINRKTEIGYWLSEKFQGQGIVTRSVKRLSDFAFKEQGINSIRIKCATGNTPSRNIPRKLGFTLEGVEREGELLSGGEYTDLEVYSLLKSDQ